MPSNRNFGFTFSIFFLIISLFLFNKLYFKYLIILALLFFILGYVNSRILTPLNILWYKFGIFLSKLMSPIALSLFFFFIFAPYGLVSNFIKKMPKNIISLNKNTYWVEVTSKKDTGDFKRQF